MYFKAQPFFKIFIFLALGIVISNYILSCNYLLVSVFIILVLAFVFVYKYNFAIYIFIFCLGFGLVKVKQNHFNNLLPDNISAYQAKIIDDVQKKDLYQKTIVKILKYKINNQWVNNNFETKMIINTKSKKQLFYGNTILINGTPTKIPKPQNPFQFDLKTYMQRQGIYYQHNIFNDKIFIFNTHDKDIFYYAYYSRHFLESKFNYYISDKNASSILNAMVLGIRTNLDSEIFASYSNSGIIHVIAISGLHIALFFTFLSKIFFWVPNFRKNQILIASFSILLMWSYTFIAGFGASVIRASIMFTFILIGKLRNKGTNHIDIYNLLFACATFMLIYNPDYLWDIGFQLSFVAVLGILFFNDYLNNIFKPRYILIKWIWDITTVTLAAQLATFPLTLFYFNKLTLNFLLANIIVIPISSILLYLSILFFAVLPFETLAQKIAYLLKDLTNLMNYTAYFNSNIPLGIFENIHFNILQLILSYLVILLVFYNIIHHSKFIKWVNILLVLIIAFIQYMLGYEKHNSKEQYILYHYKSPIFYFRNGNSELICASKKLTSQPTIIDYSLQKFRANNFISKSNTITIENNASNLNYSIFVINGKRIVYLFNKVEKNELSKLGADFIFIPDYLNNYLKDYLSIEKSTIIVNNIGKNLIYKNLHSLSKQGAIKI